MNKKNILVIVLLVIVLIAIILIAKKPKDEVVMPGADDTTAVVSSTTTTTTSPNKPAPKPTTPTTPIPANTLVLVSPIGGEMFRTGTKVSVAWDSSVDLTNAMVVVTLMKAGKELTTITEKGGAPADLKTFSWNVTDVSVWGEEGFSLKVTTTGLKKNLTAQSGTFTVVKTP